MFGDLGIYLAFVSALLALLLFFASGLGKQGLAKWARLTFFVHAAGVVGASIYLLHSLLTHQFQYFYVYAHTERGLALEYLVSAFWAGQEGTLLLWALMGAAIGLFIIWREKEYEAPVMTVITAVQLFLVFFLVVQSPFRLLSQVPPDGAGLNPLLINPWMVLHPPVIFAGYALMVVPFAMALTALWKRDYQVWVSKALPWALLGWFALGVGIFVGGYWAYRVLGWGGYWSWDPVENASLVPWLTAGAMIHGYFLQIKRKLMIRANIILTIITYILILYATFLTRSGVLEDFSVHSFARTPLASYFVAFMMVFLGAGTVLFFLRLRDIPSIPDDSGHFTRGKIFMAGIVVLIASAAFIGLGTSSPVITGWFGIPSAVDESYYMLTNTPVAILLALTIGLVTFLSWKREDIYTILIRIYPAVIAALCGVVFTFAIGIREPVSLVYLGSAVFALASASIACYQSLRKKGIRFCGGDLAHMGVALMLIGLIASMVYSQEEILSLSRGEEEAALGYVLTYQERIPENDEDQMEGDLFQLDIAQGGASTTVYARMYYAGRDPMLMRDPAVQRYWWGDLFVSPMELREKMSGLGQEFTIGETKNIRGVEYSFQGFEAPGHDTEGIVVIAQLKASQEGEKTILEPMLRREGEMWDHEPASTPDGGQVLLEWVQPEDERALFRFVSPFDALDGGQEILVLEVSRKPLILVLALGTILVMAGTCLASWKHITTKRKT